VISVIEVSKDSDTAAGGFDVRPVARATRTAAVLDAEFGQDRPRIVVLCGSARFYDQFQEANYRLTMAGKIVLSIGFYPDAEHGQGEGVGLGSAEKVALDGLHKRKIDLADEVHVINVGGYIGASTRSEINYAEAAGKPVTYMESR
jgi:hypothetical protein